MTMQIAYCGKAIRVCPSCVEHVEREFPVQCYLSAYEATRRWPHGVRCWYCGEEAVERRK